MLQDGIVRAANFLEPLCCVLRIVLVWVVLQGELLVGGPHLFHRRPL